MVKLWNSFSCGFFLFLSGFPEILTLARFSILVTSSSAILVTSSSDTEPVVKKNFGEKDEGRKKELLHAEAAPEG